MAPPGRWTKLHLWHQQDDGQRCIYGTTRTMANAAYMAPAGRWTTLHLGHQQDYGQRCIYGISRMMDNGAFMASAGRWTTLHLCIGWTMDNAAFRASAGLWTTLHLWQQQDVGQRCIYGISRTMDNAVFTDRFTSFKIY